MQPLWLLVCGYWLWLVWSCAGDWTQTPDYNYGWFVPPLALYFLWKRMERPQGAVERGEGRAEGEERGRRTDAGARWLAWVVIALSVLVIFPIELARQAPMHWRFYPWVIGLAAFGTTLATAWLTGGAAGLRTFLFPSIFALAGIPWPTFFENLVAFPLMGIVTAWSAALIQLLGYPATVAGNVITLPTCTVGVEEACSGLRSVQTALMVGLAAGELKALRTAWRLVLVAIAFLLALVGNQIRVLILVMAGIEGGSAAVSATHDLAGYAVLGVLLGGVAAAAWLVEKVGVQKMAGGPQGAQSAERKVRSAQKGEWGRKSPGVVLLGGALLAMLAAHAWYWSARGEAARPAAAMLEPRSNAGFVVDKEVPPTVLEVLRPDEWNYIRAERSGRAAEVVGYHFYWRPGRGNARQMYHRPDSCMPGAGWRIDGAVTRETLRIGDRQIVFNVFPFRNPGGRSLIYWAAYLNGQPVELEFESDLRLATTKLWDYVRDGVSRHSYEVAAFLMDGNKGAPAPAEAEAYANRVFAPAAVAASAE